MTPIHFGDTRSNVKATVTLYLKIVNTHYVEIYSFQTMWVKGQERGGGVHIIMSFDISCHSLFWFVSSRGIDFSPGCFIWSMVYCKYSSLWHASLKSNTILSYLASTCFKWVFFTSMCECLYIVLKKTNNKKIKWRCDLHYLKHPMKCQYLVLK